MADKYLFINKLYIFSFFVNKRIAVKCRSVSDLSNNILKYKISLLSFLILYIQITIGEYFLFTDIERLRIVRAFTEIIILKISCCIIVCFVQQL